MKDNKIDIGIVGKGVVGDALRHYFTNKGIQVKVYDKYKESDSLAETVESSDLIFICVPTPPTIKGHCNVSIIEGVVKEIDSLESSREKKIIIKSTVVPKTTENLQSLFPKLNLYFMPEFLTAKTAKIDITKPDRIVIGYTEKTRWSSGREDILKMIKLFPDSAKLFEMSATEAEFMKYMANSLFALKVSFANQIYDLSKVLGVDYNKVQEAVMSDNRIGKSHLDVTMERGYGGMCLPKDVSAIVRYAYKQGIDLSILREAEIYNKKVRNSK